MESAQDGDKGRVHWVEKSRNIRNHQVLHLRLYGAKIDLPALGIPWNPCRNRRKKNGIVKHSKDDTGIPVHQNNQL